MVEGPSATKRGGSDRGNRSRGQIPTGSCAGRTGGVSGHRDRATPWFQSAPRIAVGIFAVDQRVGARLPLSIGHSTDRSLKSFSEAPAKEAAQRLVGYGDLIRQPDAASRVPHLSSSQSSSPSANPNIGATCPSPNQSNSSRASAAKLLRTSSSLS